MNIVGCRWVFKTKLHSDGALERLKARLVAKGSTPVPGVDFTETYSPVIKPTTIRVVLIVALAHKWDIQQLDVKNAFLHGKLSERVYMEQPPGFNDVDLPDHTCHLKWTLYGLRPLMHSLTDLVFFSLLSNFLAALRIPLYSLVTVFMPLFFLSYMSMTLYSLVTTDCS